MVTEKLRLLLYTGLSCGLASHRAENKDKSYKADDSLLHFGVGEYTKNVTKAVHCYYFLRHCVSDWLHRFLH